MNTIINCIDYITSLFKIEKNLTIYEEIYLILDNIIKSTTNITTIHVHRYYRLSLQNHFNFLKLFIIRLSDKTNSDNKITILINNYLITVIENLNNLKLNGDSIIEKFPNETKIKYLIQQIICHEFLRVDKIIFESFKFLNETNINYLEYVNIIDRLINNNIIYDLKEIHEQLVNLLDLINLINENKWNNVIFDHIAYVNLLI
jgi:hypothetical protein